MIALPALALGTVQLGQDYGLLVKEQRPDDQAADQLLDDAWTCGIRCFDTARLYGASEERLGNWASRRGHQPIIITKIAGRPEDTAANQHVQTQLAESRRALCDLPVAAALLHRPSDILDPAMTAAMIEAKAKGMITGWGVSSYSLEEFAAALLQPDLSIIEAPLSLFDRRLQRTDLLAQAARQSVQVIARSVFLQGAILAEMRAVPPALPRLRKAVEVFSDFSTRTGIPRGALAMAYALSLPGISTLVVGAASAAQVRQIAAWAASTVDAEIIAQLSDLPFDHEDTDLDPRHWHL